VEDTPKLRRLRSETNVTRENIVRVVEISLSTVRNAEAGKRIRYQSALQILKAMNHWITQKNPDRPLLTPG
jgi:DNA-binding transcriptional regulator YiaG